MKSRTNRTKRTKRSWGTRAVALVTPLVFVLLILCLVVTAVDSRFYVEPATTGTGTRGPVISVKATRNPEVYDTVDVRQGTAGDLKFSVQVRGQCPERYRLLKGTIEFGNGTQLRRAEFRVNQSNRSIGSGHGEGWEVYEFVVPFMQPDVSRSPADVCNTELQRASGPSARARMLQEGFDIDFSRAYKSTISVTCHKDRIGFYEDPDYLSQTRLPAVIRCLPTGYKGPPRAPVEPKRTAVPDPPIASAVVTADPVETQGRACPVYVNFRGRVTAGENSAYEKFNTKYRFVGDNNYKTDWLPVSVVKGEPRSVNWRRFVQAPENDGGSFKTPGGRVKIPVYRGWMMLEVLLPNGTKTSERADFTVDCNPQPKIKSR